MEKNNNSEPNQKKKSRLSAGKKMAVALYLLFSLQGCADRAEFSHTFTKEDAKELTVGLHEVEQYKQLTIEKAILRNNAVINKIMSSTGLQEFIGEDGMKHCNIQTLMPISLLESRGGEAPKGKEGEVGLYHIKPGTRNDMKKAYGNKSGRDLLNDPSVAGAIYFLIKCAVIEEHIAAGEADPESEKELLQMAYTLHNTGRDNYFINKGYKSWTDLEKEFVGMLLRDPAEIDLSDRKNRMKEYNEDMPEHKKQVITLTRALQLITPKNKVNILYLPTYRSGTIIGGLYEILKNFTL